MGFINTPEHIIQGLYILLKNVDNILNFYKIPYFIIGGTLLGYYRGNKIIPWDDDVDIGILERYKQGLYLLLKLELNDYNVEHSVHGIKIKKDKVSMDIFFYKLIDDKYVLESEKSRLAWPNDYFYPNEIVTSRKIFNEIEISVPIGERYLKCLYGDDCFTHAYLQFDHINNKRHSNREKIEL